MIAHVTVGYTHVLLANPAPGAACRCVLVLCCRGETGQPCGSVWPIVPGDPLEART